MAEKNILGSFLSRHPLEREMRFPLSPLFPPCREREKWEALPSDIKEEIGRIGKDYAARPFPVLRASDYMAYVRENDRKKFETPYFLRRMKLMAVLLKYCAFCREEDLIALGDMIWAILEESTWVLPAHNEDRLLPESASTVLDLFSAQTGMLLSFCLMLCGEELEGLCPELRARAEKEILNRVIVPFETRNDLWWTGFTKRKDLNNWTPWIVSNAMLCACVCLRRKERLARLLTRACLMLDCYIDFMPEDGGCDEGAGYWNMAGGALLDALELLRSVTGGRIDLFGEEKLRALLTFPAKAWLGGERFVNFADCDARPYLSAERLRAAGRVTGDRSMTALGFRMEKGLQPGFSDTPQLWRLLNRIFERPEPAPALELPPRDVYLCKIQLRVVEKGGLTLVCKGGSNHESHNHNDVGAFMVYAGEEGQIVDAGNMTYSRLTFSARRDEIWNIRSENHNVPMLGISEQRSGEGTDARNVEWLEDGLRLDMAAAYPPGTAVSALREMRNTKDGIQIRDRITLFEEREITYVFMTRHEPRIEGCTVTAGRVRIRPDQEMRVSFTVLPVTDPRMAKSWPGSLYRVTFTAPGAVKREDCFRITLNS